MKKIFLLFVTLFVFAWISVAQNVRMDLKMIDSLSISNMQNQVPDINGEQCSLVILNTNLDSLKFYTNLGVEKVTRVEEGYRVWFPNQATDFKFSIPGYPLYEYKLPHSSFRYSVFLIFLEVDESQRIIIKDTLRPVLSISTDPAEAKVFLNDHYLGKSPVIINNPDFNRFDLLIKKRRYSGYHANDSMDVNVKNISIELIDLSRSKRLFLTLNTKWDGLFKTLVDDHAMPGLFLGVFGKTGWYGSFNFRYLNHPEITNSYKDFNPDYYVYNFGNKLSFNAGVTQQLGKFVFIYGGAGYISRYYENTRTTSSNKNSSIILNTGFIFRIGWYNLLQIDYSKSLNMPYSSFGFGFGLNLPVKKQ